MQCTGTVKYFKNILKQLICELLFFEIPMPRFVTSASAPNPRPAAKPENAFQLVN